MSSKKKSKPKAQLAESREHQSNISITELPGNLLLSNDYSSVLGLSLCLLSGRLVGRSHIGRNFVLKSALIEELDAFQTRLVHQAQEEDTEGNGGGRTGFGAEGRYQGVLDSVRSGGYTGLTGLTANGMDFVSPSPSPSADPRIGQYLGNSQKIDAKLIQSQSVRNLVGFTDSNTSFSKMEECFFFFDTALRKLINPTTYHLPGGVRPSFAGDVDAEEDSYDDLDASETDSVTDEDELSGDEVALQRTVDRREKKRVRAKTAISQDVRMNQIKHEWEKRRKRVHRRNLEVFELFWVAANLAWDIFTSVFNEWRTLETVTGVSYEDIKKSGTVFRDLLLSTKVLVACAYYRELEEKLEVKRRYEDTEVVMMKAIDVVTLLMDSSFIHETKRNLKATRKLFNMSVRFTNRKKTKGKKVEDLPSSVTYILRHALVVDRIVTKYCKRNHEDASYYRDFGLDRFPSVFQRRVIPPKQMLKPQKKKKPARSTLVSMRLTAFFSKQDRSAPQPVDRRIALITEDADTSLITKIESGEVLVVDANALRPLATVRLNQFKISASTSNNNWLIFGCSEGNVYLYHVGGETKKVTSRMGIGKSVGTIGAAIVDTNESIIIDQEIAKLKQGSHVSALIIDSTKNRLFVGDVTGAVCEWDMETFELRLNLSEEHNLKQVTCLATDERPSPTKRHPAKILVSGHSDGAIYVWSILQTRSVLLKSCHSHTGNVTAIGIQENELFSGGADSRFMVWGDINSVQKQGVDQVERKPVTDGRLEQYEPIFSKALEEPVTALAIDEQIIVLSTSYDIYLYERTQMAEIEHMYLPSGKDCVPLYSMTIDRRRRLYTVDCNVRIWDIEGLLQTINIPKQIARQALLSSPGRPSRYSARPRQESKAKPPFLGAVSSRLRTSKNTNRMKSALENIFLDDSLAVCFETTLFTILNHPVLRRKFLQFLKEQYAEENLHYWLSVQQYQYLSDTSAGDGLCKYGKDIIDEYIRDDCPQPVNISAQQRKRLLQLKMEDFRPKTFDETQKEVYALLDKNFRYGFVKESLDGDEIYG